MKLYKHEVFTEGGLECTIENLVFERGFLFENRRNQVKARVLASSYSHMKESDVNHEYDDYFSPCYDPCDVR